MRSFDQILGQNLLTPAEKAWAGTIGPRNHNWSIEHIVHFVRDKTGEDVDPSSVEDYLRRNGLPIRHVTENDTAVTDTDAAITGSILVEESETTFRLERDLQLALRSNIQQLESGLTIIDDGKERTTDAGRIDITASDGAGSTVVIELKAGTAAPEALTQLLAYMGAIGKQEQKSVRGMLVAGDFHPRVIFAAKAVSAVQLRKYRYKFTFEVVE
jgi:RecB family endonuclease NucS